MRNLESYRPSPALVGLVVAVLTLGVTAPAARADDVGPPVADLAGDCLASGCADLVSVAAGLEPGDGQLTFRFTSVRYWQDFNFPPLRPLPEIWIWTRSPDTSPPDATVARSGARIAGGLSFSVRVRDLRNGLGHYGPTNAVEFTVNTGVEDDIPGFLTSLGRPFRWRAVIPADEGQAPGAAPAADSVPDSGSIAYTVPDADVDGLPDKADPCPAQAFQAPAPGWSFHSGRDGCPAAAAPLGVDTLQQPVTDAASALAKLWRDPRRRASAMRTRYLDLPLRSPAGLGVQAGVVLADADAPFGPSLAGVRKCAAGRCVIRMKLKPDLVRRFGRARLLLDVSFETGRGTSRIITTAHAALRMPFRPSGPSRPVKKKKKKTMR